MVNERISIRAVREDGAEFYTTENIRRLYLYELNIDEISDAAKPITVDYVGKLVGRLNIGEHALKRVQDENNKPLRGVWIYLAHLNETLKRYKIEPISAESRGQGKNVIDVTGDFREVPDI
jgi:hypothetical protein